MPDWRWQRAAEIARGGTPLSRRHDDAWIRRAAQFQAVLARGSNDEVFEFLFDRDPDLFDAHRLWVQRDGSSRDGRRFLARALEARLLGRQDDATVAKKTRLVPAAVEAYRKVFYDIDDCWDNEDFVMGRLIGPLVHSGLRERDYEIFWLMAAHAWRHNPAVLEWFILTEEPAVPSSDPSMARAIVQDAIISNMTRKMYIASKTTNASDVMATPGLQQFYIHVRQMEQAAHAAGGATLSLLESFKGMTASIPFAVAGRSIEDLRDRGTVSSRPDHGMAAELRGDELVGLALGQHVSIDALNEPTFPEPTADNKLEPANS